MRSRHGLLIAIAALLPATGSPEPVSVAELEACMRAKLPALSSVQTVSLRHVDRTGGERTIEAAIFWKRNDEGLSRVRIQVYAPADDRGSAYLLIEPAKGDPEMFVYLPEIGRPRRIHPNAASGSLFGTNFNYADVGRIQDIADGTATERLPDEKLGDTSAAVVAAKLPPGAGFSYTRIVYWVDAERCVPLKIEFQDAAGAVQRRLVADPKQITKEGRGWLVRALALEDLRDQTRTELLVLEIEVEAEIKDSIFTAPDLSRRR